MAVQAICILNQRKQALNTRKVPGLTSSIENEALRAQPTLDLSQLHGIPLLR